MSLIHYAIIGTAACASAIGGAFVNFAMQSQPTVAETDTAKPTIAKETTPQISVPIYSGSKKLGYCIVRAASILGGEGSGGGHGGGDTQSAVPRITNALFVEFAKPGDAEVNGAEVCTDRIGAEVFGYQIVEAEFFEED